MTQDAERHSHSFCGQPIVVCFNPQKKMLMNSAFKSAAQLGQRRLQSTTSIYASRKANMTVRNNWLNDPSTYPLIVCMGGAGALVVGVATSCLAYSPDVQISPAKRGAIMRHWNF